MPLSWNGASIALLILCPGGNDLPQAMPPASKHPLLSANTNSMHDDSFNTDTSPQPGPLGRNPKWDYVKISDDMGMCPTFVFDSRARMITIAMKKKSVELRRIDPGTLRTICSIDLPAAGLVRRFQRFRRFYGDPDTAFQNVSGGPYLFVDHRDRIVVPTIRDEIRIVEQRETSSGPKLVETQNFKVRKSQAHPEGIGEGDGIVGIFPDWGIRDLIWFVTSDGVVGLLNAQNGAVRTVRLPKGEEIRNSLAVSREGAFVLSSRALYRFRVGGDHRPDKVWEAPYPTNLRFDATGAKRVFEKPGILGDGSGTTPTLFGADYVAIGDLARSYMNVVVFRRSTGALVASKPVFTPSDGHHANNRSHSENSFIAFGNSLVVCNTYGYTSPFNENKQIEGGLVRLDFDESAPAASRLKIAWCKPIRIWSTTPKLSTANQIIYAYTYYPADRMWAAIGVRFSDGELAFRVNVHAPDKQTPGPLQRNKFEFDKYDNAWGPVFIGHASHGRPSIYVGMVKGFLRVMDQG